MTLDELPAVYIAILRHINARKGSFGPADHTNPADIAAAQRRLETLKDMERDGLVREIKTHNQRMTSGRAGDLYNVTPFLSEEGQRLALGALSERLKALDLALA